MNRSTPGLPVLFVQSFSSLQSVLSYAMKGLGSTVSLPGKREIWGQTGYYPDILQIADWTALF